MASSLEWSVINEDETKTLLSSTNAKECRTQLATVLNMKQEDSAEFHVYFEALVFSRQLRFSPRQISTLIAIVRKVHEYSMEVLLTQEKSFQYFTELLVKHCIERPPYSVGIFTCFQAQKIVEWIGKIYYAQYKLYQGIRGAQIEVTLSMQTVDEFVELPPRIKPLHEASLSDESPMREPKVCQN
eukprot:g7219.t1